MMKIKQKHWLVFFAVFCVCSLLYGCKAENPETIGIDHETETMVSDMTEQNVTAGQPVTIWVASDLHYLSRELYNESPVFIKTLEQGDGKLTERMPEILDIFVAQVLTARPDALVLAGDLTFNGEVLSLRELADQLNVVRSAGIPVLVIPGNHEAINYMPVSYRNGQMSGTEPISRQSFWEICGPFGYDQAVSRDELTFSYVYELADDMQLILLDANLMEPGTEYVKGSIPGPTMEWLEQQLAMARQAGKTVLTVTHQNVLPQNPLLYYDYALYNYKEVSALLEKYGAMYNVSGHSHIQHLAQKGKQKDLAVGPLSVTPLRYAVLTIDEERQIHYEVASLTSPRPADAVVVPVPEVAEKLTAEATARYNVCQRRRVMEVLEEIQQRAGFSDTEQEIMTAFALEVNQAYIAGEPSGREAYLASEGWGLWTKYCRKDFWWQYLNHILTES